MLIGFQIKNISWLVLEFLSYTVIKLKSLELFILRPNELFYLVPVVSRPVYASNFAHLMEKKCFLKDFTISPFIADIVLLRALADS